MRILLACPTSYHKKYCQEQWIESVKKLNPAPDEVLIVDNSNGDGNSKLFKKAGFNSIWVRPHKRIDETIAYCCNLISDYAIKKKFDYVFMLESDQFSPLNILHLINIYPYKLLSIPYFHGNKDDTRLLMYRIHDVAGFKIARWMLESDSFDEFDGTIKEIYQPGLGCIFIHRSVLEKIKFRIAKPGEYGYVTEKQYHDYFFHLDCYTNNIPSYCYTGAICRHYNNMILGHIS